MNETVLTWIVFILAFGGMVLIHEFGHFIAARLSKIEVEEFRIGLPTPGAITLFKWQGTRFTLNWLPLGGFVRPKGENDPNVPGGLAAAIPWKRLFVLISGPAMNLLTAVLIYAIIFSRVGVPDPTRVLVASVSPEAPSGSSTPRGSTLSIRLRTTSGSPGGTARIIGPDLETIGAPLVQTGAGEYQASTEISQPGAYLVRLGVNQGDDSLGQVTLGLAVPYSPEYRASGIDLSLLSLLAALTTSPQLITFLRGHTAGVESVAFSPDGRYLAALRCSGHKEDGKCMQTQEVLLWRLENKRLIPIPFFTSEQISELAFSPNGEILAGGGINAVYLCYFVQGALNRDYPLVMGVVIVYASFILLFNLLADLAYAELDPRVRQGYRGTRG